MKLLTQAVRKKLPKLYSQEKNPDPMVVVKFFNPYGPATWWITEGNEEGDDFIMFGLCMLFGPDEAELGYVSLNELQSIKGIFGLGMERDMYWTPKPLSEVKKKYGIR